MYLNLLLAKFQKTIAPYYQKSVVLKNLDGLIFVNIILLIFATAFTQSDNIAYFALGTIFLTIIKIFVKPGERFVLSLADKFLLTYFITNRIYNIR